MNDKKYKIAIGDGWSWVGLVILAILCTGSPDILDGLIKWANAPHCEVRP